MKKVLANDGISASGKEALEKEGFEVITTKVAEAQLANFINKNAINALLVRSATQVSKELIDATPSLQLIGRGGVGMDNIEVDYARSKNIYVINTPAASSESVAELVFAHLFGGVRFLYSSNRNMPLEGDSKFKVLKKTYAAGTELRGKTLGIIGFGRIGQAVAKIALGIGMKVVYNDHHLDKVTVSLPFFDGQSVAFEVKNSELEYVYRHADFITLHVPAQKTYVVGQKEFSMMKKGIGIINTSRGGVLDEAALMAALEKGRVAFAGLDVFESEPSPEIKILMHPKISMTPHIGAATEEAQDRIGLELAAQIITLLK
ncbi:MAG: D-2-hydroxyacid dehydrogenase [Bacteroidota bacterium]